MKLMALGVAVAALLAAGSAYAHGDTHATKKKMEMKQTDFGRTGDPKKVSRTVKIDMSDNMRFTPAELTVRRATPSASWSRTRARSSTKWSSGRPKN